MRNRLNGLRKTEGVSESQLDQVEVALKEFCTESIQRKKQIKTQVDYKLFVDWLFEQERVFEKLCEEVEEQ